MRSCHIIAPVLLTFTALFLVQSALAQEGTTLYTFTGDSNGGVPYAGLVMDKSGNLYGTASQYGAGPCSSPFPGCGTVFELTMDKGAWSLHLLYTFQGDEDGSDPTSDLVLDREGDLYGTTTDGGGPSGCGTVFELKPSAAGWQESILYRFTCGADGSFPSGPLAFDSRGNIYGVTIGGGDRNCYCGVVFELTRTPDGWIEGVLHTFVGSDGANPYSGVTIVPFQFCQGGLPGRACIFGTTESGGLGSIIPGGVIFQLLPSGNSSWNFRLLYEFPDAAGRPGGPLVFDKTGTLYGMAGLAGIFGAGAVFKLAPIGPSGIGWSESDIYSFRGPPDGWFSLYQGLVFDRAGNLYGETSSGGTSANCNGGCGTVFRLSRIGETWYESGIYSLPGGSQGGQNPYAGTLVVDQKGNVYGTAPQGGDLSCVAWGEQEGCGVVFQVSP